MDGGDKLVDEGVGLVDGDDGLVDGDDGLVDVLLCAFLQKLQNSKANVLIVARY